MSAIQIGITLLGIIAGAYSGENLGKYFEPFINKWDALAPYSERISFTLVIVIVTYFSLIIGELVPKTLALNNPEKVSIKMAPFIKVFSIITYPFVLFLSGSTKIVLKILFIKQNEEPPVTEEELKYLIDTGSRHGIIEKGEGKIMNEVFRFGDKTAGDIMTLRPKIAWLNINQPSEKLLRNIYQEAHTKYPVCDDSLDKILGVVMLTEVLKYSAEKDFNIRDHLLPPLIFPEESPALHVLEEFRTKKIHLGFVVDEYGSTVGIITLHDLIENIVGDFPDLLDDDEPIIVMRSDGSFVLDGDVEIEELQKWLNLKDIEAEGKYRTLAGLLIYLLKSKPVKGKVLDYKNYNLKILKMKGQRIEKVLATKK